MTWTLFVVIVFAGKLASVTQPDYPTRTDCEEAARASVEMVSSWDDSPGIRKARSFVSAYCVGPE